MLFEKDTYLMKNNNIFIEKALLKITPYSFLSYFDNLLKSETFGLLRS